MARPSGPKTRNNGEWTEARFNSFVKSALRQATRRWGPLQTVKKKAWVSRGVYECASCKEHVPLTTREGSKRHKNVIVDHVETIVPTVEGFTTWDECIERMFCEEDNLQVLCKACHDQKSSQEKSERSLHKNWPSLSYEYNSWRAMRGRCLFKSHESYHNYGGRGITICDEWVNSFEAFRKDMGERPEGYSLDRADNNGNYEPSNCKWSSFEEQANNRRNTIYLEIDGERKSLSQWSKDLGIPKSTIGNRLARGDTNQQALALSYDKKVRTSKVMPQVQEMLSLGLSEQEIKDKLDCHPDTVRKIMYKIRRTNAK